MSARNVKRVIHGVLAVVAFLWAAEQYALAGFAPPTLMIGGLSALFVYLAATGTG
jgi:hypothetical protein